MASNDGYLTTGGLTIRQTNGSMRAEKLNIGILKEGILLLTRLPAVLARALIRTYQLILSPFIGNQCRFHPSCSHYAMEAVDTHGVVRGSWLTLKRLSRCHPFHAGGFDPVPGSDMATGARDLQLKADHNNNEASEFYPGAKEI
jgi:putative membrane protein insertion efficiency factor